MFNAPKGITAHKGNNEFLPKKESENDKSYWNQIFAQSIRLSNGVTIRKLRSGVYVVRIKNGEEIFNRDFLQVWNCAITKTLNKQK